MPFESPDENLGDLLKRIASGSIQLPDFQREWKWDDDIASLLASISLGYPVGVVMTLETTDEGTRFAPIALSGAVASRNDPDELLLDGQQRLTSLFQALLSQQPVETTDSKRKRMSRWYYINMAMALDPEADREEAIVSVPSDKRLRDNFGREIAADYSTTALECAAEMFPLASVFDTGSVFNWQNEYLTSAPVNPGERSARWIAFYKGVIENFVLYKVPVIRLHKSTPKEAVCVIFEKVNTGGVALNVFELLTAAFASDNFRLKDDWAIRKAKFDKRPVLRSLESADFLQVVSLLATYERRRSFLAGGGESSQAPGVSCKRKDILRLSLEEYTTWADKVTSAFEWVSQFLGQEHIFGSADLPYRTQMVPLAAARVVLGDDADLHGISEKLRQWYWCGVLGELYGGAIETRFARDLEQLVDWASGGQQPGSVVDASFRAPRLLTLRTRNSAAYKGIYALLMREECLDWLRREPMNLATFYEYKVDIHHIFPKAWCERNGIEPGRRESIVNKTAISAATNRSIGGRSPKVYMATLASRAGITDSEIDVIIATHFIEPSELRAADFSAFFNARTEALLSLISTAMGKEATREEDTSEDGDINAYEDETEDLTDDSGAEAEDAA